MSAKDFTPVLLNEIPSGIGITVSGATAQELSDKADRFGDAVEAITALLQYVEQDNDLVCRVVASAQFGLRHLQDVHRALQAVATAPELAGEGNSRATH